MAQICARANGELGKNAEDRKRNLQVALGQGPDYLQALDTVRRWEQRTEHLQALIDAQTDIRRRDGGPSAPAWSTRCSRSARRARRPIRTPRLRSTTRSTTARCSGRQRGNGLSPRRRSAPLAPRSGREPPPTSHRVSYARLYNLGNYENERFEAEAEGCRRQRQARSARCVSRRSRPSASAGLSASAPKAAPRGVACRRAATARTEHLEERFSR